MNYRISFLGTHAKNPFHFSRFHKREITAGKHPPPPPPSLLSSHPKKHMLPLGLVTTEISVEITIEFWNALGQSLPCTSTQKNRGETQSSVSSTTNSYVSLCEQQEEKAGAFFLFKCKNWYRLEIKENHIFHTDTTSFCCHARIF